MTTKSLMRRIIRLEGPAGDDAEISKWFDEAVDGIIDRLVTVAPGEFGENGKRQKHLDEWAAELRVTPNRHVDDELREVVITAFNLADAMRQEETTKRTWRAQCFDPRHGELKLQEATQ